MKKRIVKFDRSVLVPKLGVFNKGQEHAFDVDYAKHLVENMGAGQYVGDSVGDDENLSDDAEK